MPIKPVDFYSKKYDYAYLCYINFRCILRKFLEMNLGAFGRFFTKKCAQPFKTRVFFSKK